MTTPASPSPPPAIRGRPRSAPVPDSSLLGAYTRSGAYTDCYEASVPGTVTLSLFVEAFYTTRLFKLERWLLATLLRFSATDEQARELAHARADRFSAWTVESRSSGQILLRAGPTRSWLSVATRSTRPPSSTLLFGSAVVPMRPGGRFGFAFHALLGFHRLYSRLLLAAASKKLVALGNAPHGA